MADVYCTEGDLYAYGLPRGAVPNPAREIASVDAGTDRLVLDQHGFALGDPLEFRAEGVDGLLPAPLAADATYYAKPVTANVFQVAASVLGTAIDMTTAGYGVLVIAQLPIDAAIEWASRIVDDMLVAHVVPLELPVPELVRMTTAELAVAKLMLTQGALPETLRTTLDAAEKRLERWGKGVPVRSEVPTKRANLSAAAPLSRPYREVHGWRTDETI